MISPRTILDALLIKCKLILRDHTLTQTHFSKWPWADRYERRVAEMLLAIIIDGKQDEERTMPNT